MKKFDPKDPIEIVPLSFDFTELIGSGSPQTPTISVIRHSGATDSDPSAMLAGAVQLVGMDVRQKVQAGVAGCVYYLKATVDTAEGYRYALAGLLEVQPA